MWWRAARGKEFDLSNKQIETLLARSSRAMRKHWYNRGSTVLYGPVVQNNLTTDGNVRFAAALRTKPRNVDEFLTMPGHIRPPRLEFANTSEMFDAFKKYILDKNIVTPEGYILKANEGHFFSFCCGKKQGKPKGFIDKAADAAEALRMVKNNQIRPEEMSGFELDRIRNIQTYVDVMTDPDFSYRDGNKIVYGKKYDDVKNANGFTAVALDLHDNNLAPIHSGFSVFTEERLEKYDIKWYTELSFDTSLDSADTTESIASRGQLSDRFDNNISQNPENASNTDGVRFSIVGELGAFGMDGNLRQNNLSNLHTAKEMSAAGKDAKTIKLATGWEKGGDGKWRMEIPDIEMKTERIYGNIREVVEAPVYLDGPLEYYVSAPELFAAYPFLRNLKVRMADLDTGHGAYYHRLNEIRIDRNALDLPEQDKKRLEELRRTLRRAENWSEKDRKNAEFLGIDSNPESIKKRAEEEIAAITKKQLYWYKDILIHEIQHAIQHSEGFAIGSSPEYFEKNPVLNEELKEEYEKAVEEEYRLKKELLDERPEFLEDFNRYFELDKTYESDAQIDEQAIWDEMDRIDQRFRDARLGELWDKYNFAYRNLIAARRNLNKGIPSFTAYMRTAGEVEARNAQKRKNMSPDEKQQSLLAETEDVAEESKIYIFDGDGKSELAENGTGEAVRFLRNGNKIIPIAEGFEFNKTANMQKAVQEYIALLKGKYFTIKEDGTKVYFDKTSAKEYARSDDTDLLKKRI